MAALIALSDIPTIPVLYKTKWLTVVPTPSRTPNAVFNSKIAIIRHDITRLQVDSIVNAANDSLLGGGGVDGAIHRAAGPRLFDECETLNGCDTGSAKITNGYKLPAKKVIHAVGPVYFREKGRGRHEILLRGCYRKSLELAEQNGLKSIAFSALSTGVYGYPSGEAADAAISEVRNFFEEGKGKDFERVVFCNFMEKDEKAYQATMSKYFPDAKDGEGEKTEAEGSKAPKVKSMLDVEPEEIAKELPDVPKDEPSAANTSGLKSGDVTDDDWVDVGKDTTVPKKATVEDVEDEDNKKH
ncbi:macro domain-like protein [Microthyrium microscopicum]|uniref:Macro domain-like protein n=1 Tax=Microthyrium microscopicum TaxID=703497 RepID=A0A6A6U930_9PEZI|nr:macro domain-like protein [Microthyrium microscopicum]